MPQISIYLDDKTLKEAELKAKQQNISLSRYIREAVASDIQKSWPKGYFKLFGSLQDDSFRQPGELSFDEDTKRAKFK